ncbi:MAG TPA: DinB family protein [bacterium]|nr:DinB family protein [bacterium]
MAEPTAPASDRDAGLAAFTQARDRYQDAYRVVPDEALRYVPHGEDYTLGGLVVHVTDVIEHYARTLEQMIAAGFGQVRVVDPEEGRAEREALIREGYGGAERARVFAEMGTAHDALAAKVRALSAADYTRKAPVLYGADATEPYPTSAADILGWLTDHYREHTTQAAELLETWKSSRM